MKRRPSPRKPLPITSAADDDTPTRRWRCPNCGQMLFTLDDKPPPDTCDFCNDMTTWQAIDP